MRNKLLLRKGYLNVTEMIHEFNYTDKYHDYIHLICALSLLYQEAAKTIYKDLIHIYLTMVICMY